MFNAVSCQHNIIIIIKCVVQKFTVQFKAIVVYENMRNLRYNNCVCNYTRSAFVFHTTLYNSFFCESMNHVKPNNIFVYLELP